MGGHSRQMAQPVQRPGSWMGPALGVGQRPYDSRGLSSANGRGGGGSDPERREPVRRAKPAPELGSPGSSSRLFFTLCHPWYQVEV